MKKQIPILMSTMMVQAELAGRKTMTRRTTGLDDINENPNDWKFSHFSILKDGNLYAFFEYKDTQEHAYFRCPYGQKGDILWVRESYCLSHNKAFRFYKADQIYPSPNGTQVGRPTDYEKGEGFAWSGTKWKPSIHMPKEASRIWLEVTDIRVERLQDITEADAIAEGVEKRPGSDSSTRFDYLHYQYQEVFGYEVDAKVSFRTLWDVINRDESWKENPWVWAVSFKVLSTTGKPAGLEKEEAG